MSFQRLIQASSKTLPRQMASAGFLFALGDIIAQQGVEKKGKNHDVIRTARLTTYGTFIFSPLMSLWLSKGLEKVVLKNKWSTLGARVALDQLVASPIVVALFFTSTTAMEGGGINDIKKKLNEKWLPTYTAAIGVWAPVQTLNLGFVPPQQRLLLINIISLFWNCFLSIQGAKGGASKSSSAPAEGSVTELLDNVPIKIKEIKDTVTKDLN